jgi:hypothetical protein
MSKDVFEKINSGLANIKNNRVHSCNCIGPQIGEPVCPCMMASVTIENGRYVHHRDLGPAPGGEGTIGNPDQLLKLFKGVTP